MSSRTVKLSCWFLMTLEASNLHKKTFFLLKRLNEDICNLSTLCSERKVNDTNKIDKKEILNVWQVWQETGNLPEDDIVSHVVTSWIINRIESRISIQCRLLISLLKESLREKERQLSEISSNASNSNMMMTSSWHQAMSEAKKQYEAIDGALEVIPTESLHLFLNYLIKLLLQTLHSIQNVVKDCPELAHVSWTHVQQQHDVVSWFKCKHVSPMNEPFFMKPWIPWNVVDKCFDFFLRFFSSFSFASFNDARLLASWIQVGSPQNCLLNHSGNSN